MDAVRHDLRESLVGLEVRTRRDLHLAAEVQAGASSARFALEHTPAVPTFPRPHDTLRFAAGLVETEGLVLEFGVASGSTLRLLAEHLPGRRVVGFDVFTGLPETWRTGFPAGAFAQAELPKGHGAELVVGPFADTLPEFLAETPGPVALLHLDADLHSSTTTVLELLGDRLGPGSVVLFDEYFNHPGQEGDEHRTWTEFVQRTGTRFRWDAYSYDHEQVVVIILG